MRTFCFFVGQGEPLTTSVQSGGIKPNKELVTKSYKHSLNGMHLGRYGCADDGSFSKKIKTIGQNFEGKFQIEFRGLGPGQMTPLKFYVSALKVIYVPIQLRLHKLDLPFCSLL